VQICKAYSNWAEKCQVGIALSEGDAKMRVIDELIHMRHSGGFFGNKLIKDFNELKKRLDELENDEYRKGLKK